MTLNWVQENLLKDYPLEAILTVLGFTQDNSLKWKKSYVRIGSMWKFFDSFDSAHKEGNAIIRLLHAAGYPEFSYRIEDTTGELYQYNY